MRMSKLVVGPVATNCYIVSDENTKEAFIIDPGAEPERIIDKVKETGVSVKAILLTHGHFDHISAVNELKREFGVDVYIGQEDADLMADMELNVSYMFGMPYAARADKILLDGDVLEIAGFSIKVLFTPGHTKGGICFYLEKENVAFSGDTIFQQSVGRTDFPTGSARVLSESIKNKLFILPEDLQLFPGHGDSTTVGYEKKYNMFL